jgi:hypothetical protein
MCKVSETLDFAVSLPANRTTPNAALTLRSFGALRNPPVSEQGAVYAKRNPVGLIFAISFEVSALARKNHG